jgi:hypothetical protein
MYAQNDQDSTSAATPRQSGNQSRATTYTPDSNHSEPVARAVRSAWLVMLRWVAGWPRITGVALVAAGWAASFAAVIVGRHLGRGAAVQTIFAATVITWAMSETKLGRARRVISDERALPGVGRYHRLATVALVTGCLLGPWAGGAALGADPATSLLTSLAVACAVASIAAHRLGRQLASRVSRVQVVSAPRAADNATGRLKGSEISIIAAIRGRPAGSWTTAQPPPAERVRVGGSRIGVDHVQP